jgi:hypothetical protein
VHHIVVRQEYFPRPTSGASLWDLHNLLLAHQNSGAPGVFLPLEHQSGALAVS